MLDADVDELAALNSDEGIVSVYLKLDPALRQMPHEAAVKFEAACTRYARSSDEWEVGVLEREKPRILAFLRARDFPGRAMAIFSSEPAGVWRVLRLDVLVPTTVAVGTRAQIETLVRVIDENPRVVVCVVERDKAAIYVVERGLAHTESEIASDVPGRHDQGGWAQARFQRHIEFHSRLHLTKVVDELAVAAGDGSPLLIGGVKDEVAELTRLLPRALKDRLLGSFPVNFKHDGIADILERARGLWVEAERRSEVDLVTQLADEARAGGPAVLGVEATIQAVANGAVRELAVADGVEAPGFECPNCDHLSPGLSAECPACGTAMAAVPDVIESAVARVYLADGKVESVFGEARHQLLALGGVAARLRF